jgi:hypothetical protein
MYFYISTVNLSDYQVAVAASEWSLTWCFCVILMQDYALQIAGKMKSNANFLKDWL